MPRFLPFAVLCLFLLAGCGQDLHFKISYDKLNGLKEGAPVVLDEQVIGKVTGVEVAKDGGHLVEVAIPLESASAATSDASFVLDDDPENPGGKRIEIVQEGPGGKPIAEGSQVRGAYPNPLGSVFPFGELLREIGGALGQLRGQVERFRQEFEKLPNSPEAKQLQEEWRKLNEEIAKTQNEAGYAMKKEILPKLQKEMEELRQRMDGLRQSAPKKAKDLET